MRRSPRSGVFLQNVFPGRNLHFCDVGWFDDFGSAWDVDGFSTIVLTRAIIRQVRLARFRRRRQLVGDRKLVLILLLSRYLDVADLLFVDGLRL